MAKHTIDSLSRAVEGVKRAQGKGSATQYVDYFSTGPAHLAAEADTGEFFSYTWADEWCGVPLLLSSPTRVQYVFLTGFAPSTASTPQARIYRSVGGDISAKLVAGDQPYLSGKVSWSAASSAAVSANSFNTGTPLNGGGSVCIDLGEEVLMDPGRHFYCLAISCSAACYLHATTKGSSFDLAIKQLHAGTPRVYGLPDAVITDASNVGTQCLPSITLVSKRGLSLLSTPVLP